MMLLSQLSHNMELLNNLLHLSSLMETMCSTTSYLSSQGFKAIRQSLEQLQLFILSMGRSEYVTQCSAEGSFNLQKRSRT